MDVLIYFYLIGDLMMNFKKILTPITIICFLSLTGCATVYRKPMTDLSKQSIKSDELLLSSNQHKIKPILDSDSEVYPGVVALPEGATVDPGAAAAGGLIGGLIADAIITGIDDHKLNVANTKMLPLQTDLKDFHYIKLLNSTVIDHMKEVSWLKINETSRLYKPKRSDKMAIINAQKNHTVLFIGVQYAINQEFNALLVHVSVELDQKSKNSNHINKLFRNNYEYFSLLKSKNIKGKSALNAWNQNNAALLKSDLQKSAVLISDMIVMDMNISSTNVYQNMNAPVIHFKTPLNSIQNGKLIKKIDSYYIVRTDDDVLHAMNAGAIINN